MMPARPGSRLPAVALLAVALLASTAGCATPKHIGEGDLGRAILPPGFEPIRLHVSPEERYVLCESEGPGNPLFLYDKKLRILKTRQYYWESFAFGKTQTEGLCVTPRSVDIVSVPDLCEARSFTKPQGLVSEGTRVHLLPGGDGWLITSPQRGPTNLWVLSRSPVRFLKEGRSALSEGLRATALDNHTGMLVLTGGRNRVEVYDLAAMRSRGVFELPCREVSGSVVAKAGQAWVGTREGTVIPIDLATGKTGRAIRLGGKGDVELALSESSGILAAMVQDRSAARQPYPTDLKVFIVGEGRLVDMASAYFETRGTLRDVAVLESTQQVAFACGSALYTWEYREEP